jgi:hypothetical protein
MPAVQVQHDYTLRATERIVHSESFFNAGFQQLRQPQAQAGDSTQPQNIAARGKVSLLKRFASHHTSLRFENISAQDRQMHDRKV